jgi:hypothetical protein
VPVTTRNDLRRVDDLQRGRQRDVQVLALRQRRAKHAAPALAASDADVTIPDQREAKVNVPRERERLKEREKALDRRWRRPRCAQAMIGSSSGHVDIDCEPSMSRRDNHGQRVGEHHAHVHHVHKAPRHARREPARQLARQRRQLAQRERSVGEMQRSWAAHGRRRRSD